jgi:predicted alpha/beta superfamily hydrolase
VEKKKKQKELTLDKRQRKREGAWIEGGKAQHFYHLVKERITPVSRGNPSHQRTLSMF